MHALTQQALRLAREGHADAALALLDDAREALDADALALLYLFVEDDAAAAVRLCSLALTQDLAPSASSTWHLRRGRAAANLGRRDEAMRDLLKVIGLAASQDQVQEANRAMVKLASMSV